MIVLVKMFHVGVGVGRCVGVDDCFGVCSDVGVGVRIYVCSDVSFGVGV